jgi:tetratricopeptide (TPR) repeat protein
MICRLLKAIESGRLPDGLGEMKADGIVYLSEAGSHRINFANIFAGLSKLLPSETAAKLEGLYKDPHITTGDKMRALLDAFRQGRVVLLLDNFENLIDSETLHIKDSEMSDALNALLLSSQHAVNAIITTRIAPRDLALVEPGRQHILSLDEGLESPYAENVLREMDSDGRLELKNASDELLGKAREKTRGYPRALEALYAILSVDRYTTLEELLEINLPIEVVHKLVGEAFSRLDPTAQKVMQALAVYNRPVSPVAIDYLLQPYLPSIDSALVLNRLVNMHFARREAGKYYLHPADREYALKTVPADEKKTSFTQHDLTLRAADYFVQARKPRAEWKQLNDLTAQLAEFELRYAAGDYDTAADVLTDIDFDCLFLWGHYRLAIELHEVLRGKISDKKLLRNSLGNLGIAYFTVGKINAAIQYFEQVLELAQQHNDEWDKGSALSALGNSYATLGYANKAIEIYEQALTISREIGYREGEGIDFENLGDCFAQIGKYETAEENYKKSVQIADELSSRRGQQGARSGLAKVYLYQNDLVNARVLIEAALPYDIPDNNHNATVLHGIITLRQRDEVTAHQAFIRAIGQADEILGKTAEYYDALDAKGLALCGLAISGEWKVESGERERDDVIAEAMKTFRRAREIAPHAGIVKRVLRLFDELVKCDEEGILKDMRKAAEGKDL